MGSSRHHSRRGSSLVESCLVMALLCLVLFGLLQVSQIVAAHSIMNHSAIATVRAASVGMNEFMLFKVSHYGTIPMAGPERLENAGYLGTDRPEGASAGARFSTALSRDVSPVSRLGVYEIYARRNYHMTGAMEDLPLVLDYDNWNGGEAEVRVSSMRHTGDDILVLELEQTLPLTMPFSRVFFGNYDLIQTRRFGRNERYPGLPIRATTYMEDHSKRYLKDY